MLSCECINNYVQFITEIANQIEINTELNNALILTSQPNNLKDFTMDENFKIILKQEAEKFTVSFFEWLKFLTVTKNQNKNLAINIDYTIKKFVFDYFTSLNEDQVEDTENFLRRLKFSPNKIYGTATFCLYLVLKCAYKHSDNSLLLSQLNFSPSNETHESFFINRILVYDDGIEFENGFLMHFKFWLSSVYQNIFEFYSQNFSEDLLGLILNEEIVYFTSQMDIFTKVNLKKNGVILDATVRNKLGIIKTLIKSSWIQIIDIIIGFLINSDLKPLEIILFCDIDKAQFIDLNETLLTHVSLSLFSCKSCLESLFQLIKLITKLESFDQELIQIFSLLTSNFFKEYFSQNQTIPRNNQISINQLICCDFVFFCTTELLNNFKFNSMNTYADILWKILIETYFFSLALQSNIDHNIANDFDSFPNSDQIGFNKLFIHKRNGSLFKSVYSNLNEISVVDSLTKSKSNDFNSNESALNNKQFVQQQRLIVFRIVFSFLNKNSSIDSIPMLNLNKINLINCLANIINETFILFQFSAIESSTCNNIIQKTNALDLVWQICSYSCEFSKKMLFDMNLKKYNEYFTFNNIIIDKIDELLVKLVKNISCDVILRPSTPPFLFTEKNTTLNLLSNFVNEIWLNVFLVYFSKIFSNCSNNQKRKSFQKDEEKIRAHLKKSSAESLSFLMKNSRIKLSKLKMKNEKIKSRNTNQKKVVKQNFVMELSICKKLIYLIQKLFELDNLNYPKFSFLHMVSKNFRHTTDDSMPSTSRSSFSSTSTLNENNVIYNDLLEKLELSTFR